MRIIIIIFCLLPLINSAPSKSLDLSSSPPHKLTILHTNDIHAHFDQFNKYGNDCSPEEIRLNKCFGGVARISYLVDKIRSEQDNVLLMDAGDEFSGSLFYKFFKSDIITQWMNGVKYDLMVNPGCGGCQNLQLICFPLDNWKP